MALLPAIIVQGVEKLTGLQISVTSPETELKAREYLANVGKAVKELKASVFELKKPFKKEIDDLDALSKPLLNKLQQREEDTEQAILAYLRKVREEVEKRNQKELEKFEKKAATAEAKAIAQGKPMPLIIPPAMAAAPPKTVELDGVKQTEVKHKKWRIAKREYLSQEMMEDLSTINAKWAAEKNLGIPSEYFQLNTTQIGKIIRAGGSIPGIKVYEKESLAQRTL